MKVEASFDVKKKDEEKDEAAGCTCLAGCLAMIVAGLVGAIGCGVMFGAAWGFLAYAAFMAACALLMFVITRKILRDKKKAGIVPTVDATYEKADRCDWNAAIVHANDVLNDVVGLDASGDIELPGNVCSAVERREA